MKASLVLGCLAPGWVIQWSYWIPWSGLALAVALTIACFVVELRRRNFRWLLLYSALLALQPGWHLLHWDELHDGVMHVRADCGYGDRSLSIFLVCATATLLVIAIRRPSLKRRTFLFGVVAAFTVLNLLALLIMFSGLYAAIPNEVYASIFTGIGGGPPQDSALFVVVCVLFYFLQRLRFRKAV